MQYRFPKRSFVATLGDREIAKTNNALVLSEVGYAIYEPVIYFPESDVALELLEKIDKTTHCPLKGDTAYFNLVDAATEHEQGACPTVRGVHVRVETHTAHGTERAEMPRHGPQQSPGSKPTRAAAVDFGDFADHAGVDGKRG